LLLVQTEPAEGSTLVEGPISVELYGVTEPGAAVKVNGRPVKVGPDGRFATVARPTGAENTIKIEAVHGGQRKSVTRHFQIRR
jgi:hypothetical protein